MSDLTADMTVDTTVHTMARTFAPAPPSGVASAAGTRSRAGSTKTPSVAIAICTYRRPLQLAATLNGLAALTFAADREPTLHVVVADNEGNADVARAVEAFAARTGLAATCVVEPRRGISQARNACLDAVPERADFVAFIDDDEIPGPEWLNALLATQARTRAAVVCGPVGASFRSAPPAWVVDGGFFEQPRRADGSLRDLCEDGSVPDASTNNALVRMSDIRRLKLRFDDRFGMTGGEDALFFRHLRAAGATMVWSPAARVVEDIPAGRARFTYLAREYFRCGSVRTAIDALDSAGAPGLRGSVRFAAKTLKKIARKTLVHTALLVKAAAGRQPRARMYVHVFELANAAGRLSRLFGFRYEHYR